MMELYSEHLHVDENSIQHRRMFDLLNMNYRPEYVTVCVVESESNGHAYLPAEIKCIDTPYEPTVDVLDHRITAYVCSCDDFWYNRSMGIESGQITPDQLTPCKHVVAAFGVDLE